MALRNTCIKYFKLKLMKTSTGYQYVGRILLLRKPELGRKENSNGPRVGLSWTTHLVQIGSCFRDFPMFWNVASAGVEISLVSKDEISRSKCSGGTAHLRTLEGTLVAKNALCWQQCFFTHSINQGWANVFNGWFICRKPKTPASCKTTL